MDNQRNLFRSGSSNWQDHAEHDETFPSPPDSAVAKRIFFAADAWPANGESCSGNSCARPVWQRADYRLADGSEGSGLAVLPLFRLVTVLQTATGPVAGST